MGYARVPRTSARTRAIASARSTRPNTTIAHPTDWPTTTRFIMVEPSFMVVLPLSDVNCRRVLSMYAAAPPEASADGTNQARHPTARPAAASARDRQGAGATAHSQSGPRNSSRSWRNPAARPNTTEATTMAEVPRPRAVTKTRARVVLSTTSSAYGDATALWSQNSGLVTSPSVTRSATARPASRAQRRYVAAAAAALATTLTATSAPFASKPSSARASDADAT